MTAGYYRFPTIHDDVVVFVSEDDLWQVPTAGGIARRLTSNLGAVTCPVLSPDGTLLAFVGREEGAPEVYVMPAEGGSARRLTYLNSNAQVIGWDRTGTKVIFSSNYGQIISREYGLFEIDADVSNGSATALPYGPARSLAMGADGQVILGRNTGDPARWKRYRGGTAGRLWIDANGDGQFVPFLSELKGNIASPMWLEVNGVGQVFFVSDHEGVGNLYSADVNDGNLLRHTDYEDYYVRNPSTDGRRIVYHAGADLHLYDPATSTMSEVVVAYHSPRVQRNRKFVSASRYIDSARLHPSGQAMALTTRGKAFAFYNHEGPVLQQGLRSGVRYRLMDWLNDGLNMLTVSDEPGEEVLEIHSTDPDIAPRRLEGLDIGRAVMLKVSPAEDKVALTNHRHELLIVDLESGELTVADHSPYRRIAGVAWSPDGRWLAYGYGGTPQTTAIRLYRLPENVVEDEEATDAGVNGERAHDEAAEEAEDRIYTVTRPVLHDVNPSFDPEGKYLYFLSYREFNPVYDSLHFDLGFPWGMRPYLLTLRADLANPFIPRPDFDADEDETDAPGDQDDDSGSEDGGDEDGGADGDENDEDEVDEGEVALLAAEAKADQADIQDDAGIFDDAAEAIQPHKPKKSEPKQESQSGNGLPPMQIDVDGIERRVIAFPVPDSRYGHIMGIKGKAIFTAFDIHGQLDGHDDWDDEDGPEGGILRAYNFKEYKTETLAESVSWFDLSLNLKKLLYSSGHGLRVIAAGEKAPSGGGPPRRTGWVDLNRVKVSVDPQREWEQMFREAWRLQRDHFWTEDMSQVDWESVYKRYFPLIERVSTRSEFSDLMWEMQGELGTSHAYEYGGDYRARPHYGQGFLGAELTWDAAAEGYRVGQLIVGDPWDAKNSTPLAAPGVDVEPGDVLVAINGQHLDEETGPAQLLVNQAGHEVLLTFQARTGEEEASGAQQAEQAQEQEKPQLRSVAVTTIFSESQARYRAWVEGNRRRVHEATGGRAGYVHIPDMGARGYAEFHRGYLAEIDRDALIVDVRYNGGGHVSQLILEKLARRRIGYDLSRWGGILPYPIESVAGPLVALTNEQAGSDGDIFCHSFKLMNLGPLVGKRTWGGVIGISPRHALVDGTITTQPEYSFWFADVGWNVENYGTDPDIEVDIAPQDFVAGDDPQLDRSIAEIERLLREAPVLKPDLESRPSRALPTLPPRNNGSPTDRA